MSTEAFVDLIARALAGSDGELREWASPTCVVKHALLFDEQGMVEALIGAMDFAAKGDESFDGRAIRSFGYAEFASSRSQGGRE